MRALRYAGGVLTRQSVTPPATGFAWTDLVAVPRTGSALAAGFAWKPPQGDVIFRSSWRRRSSRTLASQDPQPFSGRLSPTRR